MSHNITMIDDLPNLEDIENKQHFQSNDRPVEPQYQKFIRGSYHNNPSSGMIPYNDRPIHQNLREQYNEDIVNEPAEKVLNCVDISNHVQGCPICSRFYHSDKTIYIIVIVLLSIVCLLLLKRILNV